MQVEPPSSVFVGWGVARLGRGEIFAGKTAGSGGVAVEMRGRLFDAPPLSGCMREAPLLAHCGFVGVALRLTCMMHLRRQRA